MATKKTIGKGTKGKTTKGKSTQKKATKKPKIHVFQSPTLKDIQNAKIPKAIKAALLKAMKETGTLMRVKAQVCESGCCVNIVAGRQDDKPITAGQAVESLRKVIGDLQAKYKTPETELRTIKQIGTMKGKKGTKTASNQILMPFMTPTQDTVQ